METWSLASQLPRAVEDPRSPISGRDLNKPAPTGPHRPPPAPRSQGHRVSTMAQNAAKLCCSIFKQTTPGKWVCVGGGRKKKRPDSARPRRHALAAHTPPPGEDRVQNPGNPEHAEGVLAAARPGAVTFPFAEQPGDVGAADSPSMPSSGRSLS